MPDVGADEITVAFLGDGIAGAGPGEGSASATPAVSPYQVTDVWPPLPFPSSLLRFFLLVHALLVGVLPRFQTGIQN
jgi:hypothetical protein